MHLADGTFRISGAGCRKEKYDAWKLANVADRMKDKFFNSENRSHVWFVCADRSRACTTSQQKIIAVKLPTGPMHGPQALFTSSLQLQYKAATRANYLTNIQINQSKKFKYQRYKPEIARGQQILA